MHFLPSFLHISPQLSENTEIQHPQSSQKDRSPLFFWCFIDAAWPIRFVLNMRLHAWPSHDRMMPVFFGQNKWPKFGVLTKSYPIPTEEIMNYNLIYKHSILWLANKKNVDVHVLREPRNCACLRPPFQRPASSCSLRRNLLEPNSHTHNADRSSRQRRTRILPP